MQSYVSPFDIALIYTALGEKEQSCGRAFHLSGVQQMGAEA
jgi:hypothetical protein